MFKPFYIHINLTSQWSKEDLKKLPFRGVTAYISPADDSKECNVQATFCSRKDPFNKKLGREAAMKAESKAINKRRVPAILAALEGASFGEKDVGQYAHEHQHEYDYVLRNFL